MSRPRYALTAFLLAVMIAYASTIVGVAGPNFVPIDPAEAWQRLINIPFVQHGSDQRSDWMGNLLMLVPLGFLVAGSLASPRDEEIDPALSFAAFVLCFLFIASVKYAQLFFPPRTVTLNYVIAQSAGTGVGILAFGAMRAPLASMRQNAGRLESLRGVLTVYTGLLILFMLMPLDFALSADDLTTQFDKLADTFTALGGGDRPILVRAALILASVLEAAPIGALLTITGRGRLYVGRSTAAAAGIGFFAMLGVYALTALLISGVASLPIVLFRTAGIAFGASCMHWLTRRDALRLRQDFVRLVPCAVPIYLLLVFGVNGLLSLDWNSSDAASDDFYDLGLLPLFNYYIVTKAQAAKNIMAHAVMYAPIGTMVWLRARHDGGKATAFALAALLSAIVEAGRFLRPGLVPDINAIPLAGIAACLSAAFMPVLWQMLSAVASGRTEIALPRPIPAPNWRDRGALPVHRDRAEALGDVEHY